jgi:hypothetical protein
VIDFLQANWASLAVLGGIIALFLLLRNLDELLGQGEPVIVEVFSNT